MRRLAAIAVIATGIVLATAIPAAAKGADEARITGPGISKPIVVGGDGEPGQAGNLSYLASETGLFNALPNVVVETDTSGPKPLPSAPTGPLGPRYVVSYRLPGNDPSGANGFLRQDIYPYAPGGPVIYTPAGQPVNDRETVVSWTRAGSHLVSLLNILGVPKMAAPPDTPAGPNWTVIGFVSALVMVLAGFLMWVRRRPRPQPSSGIS